MTDSRAFVMNECIVEQLSSTTSGSMSVTQCVYDTREEEKEEEEKKTDDEKQKTINDPFFLGQPPAEPIGIRVLKDFRFLCVYLLSPHTHTLLWIYDIRTIRDDPLSPIESRDYYVYAFDYR